MNHIENLASRARAGNTAAVAELKQELGNCLVRMVRRTMRTKTGNSPWSRRILAEVRSVSKNGWDDPEHDREETIGRIARRICETVIRGLGSGPKADPNLMETVRG